MIGDKQFFDGPREDDRPYAFLSDAAKNNIDIKIYKTIKLGQYKLKMYAEIENAFNDLTPRRINPFTGRGYGSGEIYGYRLLNSPNPNEDPSRYSRPRSMEIGIQFIF